MPSQNPFQPSANAFIPGPCGELEALISYPKVGTDANCAIICHPHPLYGGTMHNKVVTTLARTFEQLQFMTVRFNFRGVGKSIGHYAQGQGEYEDLKAVIAWLTTNNNHIKITLAGFSFGAYIAARVASEIPAQGLITIAPPVDHFAMQQITTINCPWILVQGDQDEIVSAEKVYTYAKSRTPKPTVIKFPNATHFFHGQLSELKQQLLAALQTKK
jgi:uncharacterized protein